MLRLKELSLEDNIELFHSKLNQQDKDFTHLYLPALCNSIAKMVSLSQVHSRVSYTNNNNNM